MKRVDELTKVRNQQKWDIVVIGGGATGLGTALDACSRGFKTLLLEANDFSKGTSSRSTKLVHGGVRYLAQGYIDLVKEALRERGLLAKNAAHLVESQTFVIPSYSWLNAMMYRVGLGFYDMFSGKLSLGATEFISKEKTLEKLPNIKRKHLRSGVLYYDGQFDDSRLAINLAQTIIEQGGCVLNYAKVTNLKKSNDGKISGVVFEDIKNQETYEIESKVVINATGVFTNSIIKMDDKSERDFVIPSQGIHLVLDRTFLPGNDALMIPKTSDGRVLFAVPWHNKVVVGTTDVPVEHADYEPTPLQDEVDFILKTASLYMLKKPTRKDVKSVFAGLRPLAAPEKDGQKTKEVSRSHKIITSKSGLITITGGKWTTYRQMAEDTVDLALKKNDLPKTACKTKDLAIHGNLPIEKINRKSHLYCYGTDQPMVEKIQEDNPEYAKPIHPNYPYTMAQVVWAVNEEMAMDVEDILARRIRLLFLDAQATIESAPVVAKLMADLLQKDEQWITEQVKIIENLAANYLLN